MKKITEFFLSVAALIGFILLLKISLDMPVRNSFFTSAGAFPAVVCGVLIFFAAIWIIDLSVDMLKTGKAFSRKEGKRRGENQFSLISTATYRLLLIGTLTVLYVYVFTPLIGFIYATALFLFVSLYLFAEMHWIRNLLLSGVISVSVFLVFQYVLHLPTPG